MNINFEKINYFKISVKLFGILVLYVLFKNFTIFLSVAIGVVLSALVLTTSMAIIKFIAGKKKKIEGE